MCIQFCPIHILMIAADLQSLVKIVLNKNAELLHCLWVAFAQTKLYDDKIHIENIHFNHANQCTQRYYKTFTGNESRAADVQYPYLFYHKESIWLQPIWNATCN